MRLKATKPLLFLSALLATNSSALPQGAPAQHGFRDIVDQAWDVVNHGFVDPSFNGHDWLQARRALPKSYATSQEAHTAITQMLVQLGDPLTRFMDAAALASTLQELEGNLASIGVADPWTVRDDTTGRPKLLHFVAPQSTAWSLFQIPFRLNSGIERSFLLPHRRSQ